VHWAQRPTQAQRLVLVLQQGLMQQVVVQSGLKREKVH
jgi:hypothetical protein